MFELYKKIANLVGGRDSPSRLGVSMGLQCKDSVLIAVGAADDTVNAEHHCVVNIKCPINILMDFVLGAGVAPTLTGRNKVGTHPTMNNRPLLRSTTSAVVDEVVRVVRNTDECVFDCAPEPNSHFTNILRNN